MDLNTVLAQRLFSDHTANNDIRRYHRPAPEKGNIDG
jgi:hypothetical protein